MSATINEQSHLYPFSGTANWEDGSGMHTWIAMDGVKQVNNLLYTDLPVANPGCPRASAWPSAQTKPGAIERLIHSSSREIYMGQFPIVIKAGAKRILWTAGVELYSPGGASTLTFVTMYISSRLYLGPSNSTTVAYAFDTGLLSPDYMTRAVAVTHSTSATQYQLADDSTTGLTPCLPSSVPLDGQDRLAYAVFTVTGDGVGIQTWARIYDLTLWQVYE